MEREWIIQKTEVTDARMRFYNPRWWIALRAIGVMLFAGAWGYGVWRHSIPGWTLVPVLLVTAIALAACSYDYRKWPEGILHFQVDLEGVHLGGLVFGQVAFAPHSALQRILVGTCYRGLMAPVLFEFRSAAIRQYDLERVSSIIASTSVILCSYQGMQSDAFEAGLAKFVGGQVPIVRFAAVDKLSQLPD